MSIHLSSESEQLITNHVASGRYRSADEVVRKALYLLELDSDYREQLARELRRDIQEAIAAAERGEVIHYESGQALEDDIKSTGREMMKQRRMRAG